MIYAAMVPVGWEVKAKKLMNRFLNDVVQVLRGDEFQKNDGPFQSAGEGYIYVRVPATESGDIRPDLYHRIKNLPLIHNLIQTPIPENEVNTYFHNIPADVVEITVPETRDEDATKHEQEQLHRANTEGDMARKKMLFDSLDQASTASVDAVEETRKEAEQVGGDHQVKRMIAACYAVIRQNQAKFMFPKTFVQKAYQNMKKQGIQAVDAFHLLPAVIQVMRGQLRLE